ncbi:MAG TPA: DUF6089 family protein [Cyclobacteriaceae bacterium]|nr:DUF6089 family protein [Cyclobacteriaceae bacterium]
MRKAGSIVFLVILFASYADAQSFYSIRRERSIMAVGGIGTSTYLGELSNEGDYIDAKPTINIGLQYYFTNRIALRSEITWYTLTGDDAKADPESGRSPRNLSFTSNNYEINVTGIVNFFPQGQRFYQRPGFNIYGFAGIGVTYFNPKTEYQGQKVALQPLQTELVKYSRITPVIPYGIGARFKAGPFVNISVEGGLRKTFTDYLDDVSTVHHDASKFSDPIAAALSDRRPEIGLPLAADGHIRGNPDKKDSYMLFTVKVEYYLPDDFFGIGNGQKKLNRSKRKSFYRYNKRGGLRR